MKILKLALFLGLISSSALADESPKVQPYNVVCKDGHEANHVLGDIQAPCRKHGGTTKAQIVAFDEPVADTSDDPEMHRIAVCKDGFEFWANTDSKKGACKGHGGPIKWDDGTVIKIKKSEHRAPKK